MSTSAQPGRPTEAELIAQHTATVEQFVLRARRIETHSLAQDDTALTRWAQGGLGMAVIDGETYLTVTTPPEEQAESAAARVRPLLLDRDPVYIPKVFKALTYLVREQRELVEFLRDRRREWERRVSEQGVPADGYRVQNPNTVTGESHEANDRELALAWLYGDVVHHDLDRRALGDQMGLEQRYQAAASLLAFLMKHAISTLRLIEQLRGAGLPVLRDVVFEAPVVVTETSWQHRADIYLGAPDQEMPADFTKPGVGWEKWGRGTQ